MPGGLAALLDDIAVLAKLAAASVDDVGAAAGRASAKAAGVVIDDTAVTPRYVHGFTPNRELPIVRKIAVGSLRNKILFILPAALLLSQFLPWLLTPILMLGGTYLAFEGAEKVYEVLTGHSKEKEEKALPVGAQGEDQERAMVRGATRTDFILSPRSWSSPSTRWPTSRWSRARSSCSWWPSASRCSSTAWSPSS
jgi:predicted DNA repair protein MutK